MDATYWKRDVLKKLTASRKNKTHSLKRILKLITAFTSYSYTVLWFIYKLFLLRPAGIFKKLTA